MALMHRTRAAIAVVLVVQGLAACSSRTSSSPSAPSAPLAIPQTIPQQASHVSSISGFVFDTAGRPLAGARVEVLDGPQTETSTTVDVAGQFTLTGTFDSTTRFRASKEGHVTATQVWSCSVGVCPGSTGARPWLGFFLAVLAPPVNIAGDYTLTFIADSACPDLPAEVRTRTYSATISPLSSPNVPANTSFDVALGGAPFLPGHSNFGIGVAGDYLSFLVWDGESPLVEQVAANTYLSLSGSAAASVGTSSVSAISAPFDGSFEYCALKSESGRSYDDCRSGQGQPVIARALCVSKNHRLILTRR
jgi:hypothetical protein